MVLNSTVLLVGLNTIIHTIFSLGSLLFILSYPYIKLTGLDVIAGITAFSFIIFKRCILVDTYTSLITDKEVSEVPWYFRDNFLRSLLGLGTKEDVTHFRSDLLDKKISKEHQDDLDGDTIEFLYNKRLVYTCSNIIIICLLFVRYDMTILIPFLQFLLASIM